MPKNKNFNIIINGVGGQGLITLVQIIDTACMIEGYDVKSSELHGLSQRGGSVSVFIRFGKKVYSPMIDKGKPDLIIGLEVLEGLRGVSNSGPNTKFLVNNYSLPFLGGLDKEKSLEELRKINADIVSAADICKDKLGNDVVSGIYLIGYAVNKGMIPLKKESILESISQVIPNKYLELNKKAFELAYEN